MFIEKNNIGSVVDFGCGDWQFSCFINWAGASYIGFDIVESIIERDRALFERDKISFCVFKPGMDLPSADLFICKDVFQHLPNSLIWQYLALFKARGRFLLITNDDWPAQDTVNTDIEDGGWRPVLLHREPFCEIAPIVLSWMIEWGGWKPTRKATCLVSGDRQRRQSAQFIGGNTVKLHQSNQRFSGAGLRRLNVGSGRNVIDDWINLDLQDLPGVDVVADLNNCSKTPLPFEDDSIDEIFISHVIEHVRMPLPMMQELHRVACPGAKATIRVPYGSSDGAWTDPTHVRPYFIQSFAYFSQPYYWRADYGYRGDWQATTITLVMDGRIYGNHSWDALMEAIRTLRNVVGEMVCIMEAVKPIRLPRRDLQVQPAIRVEFFNLPPAS